MSAKVLDLFKEEPHLSGKAKCYGCQHTWEAKAPVGVVTDLECPKCTANKGFILNGCYPPQDEYIYTCECKCDLFVVTKKNGFMCVNCGLYHRPYD